MATVPTAGHDTTPTPLDAFDDLIASRRRHLRAQRMSPSTITTYGAAVRQLAAYLRGNGVSVAPGSVRREHVEAWITDLLDRWKPTTAHNRYRGAHAFFRMPAQEGEVSDSPMDRMKPPRLPEAPPPVLRDGDLRALFAICEKDRTFIGRRDEAIVRTLADTGIRRSDCRASNPSLERNMRWVGCRRPASSPRKPTNRRLRAVSSVKACTTALLDRRVRLASAVTSWSVARLRRIEIGCPV